tara:strand:+ start:737 stop:1150 length:414 start_codon:yes stop_codon:yes gene_type:complete
MIIYFDENMPKHLAHGFNTIQSPEGLKSGHNITVKFLPEVFNYGADDKDWIPKVGKERSCVITQDINISRRKDELELFQKNGVGMFFLKGPSKKQGLSVWQMVQALAKNWDAICEIASEEKRPFGYIFYLNGKMKRI